jgi:U4/U6.U5 tri-snRNP-associated protein 2
MEVSDKSLSDIRYNLTPLYSEELVNLFEKEVMLGRSLEGVEFIPGFVGLNNLKSTAFANVII